MAYTFCFLTDTERKVYDIECGKCNATTYFVLQESRQKGEIQCPYCAKELKIWETYDGKESQERIRSLALQEREDGDAWKAQDKEKGPSTTQGH